jgi:Yip1 domain
MALFDRVKNIIINPKAEWQVINSETSTGASLIFTYLFPLALIAAVATFIGFSFLTFGGIGFGTEYGLIYAGIMLVQLIVSVYVNALVTDALAPSFGSEKNIGKSMQLVVYAATPAYVGAILNIIPAIGWLGSLAGGIYSIYLLYLGIPVLKKTPQDKVPIYLIVIIIVLILIYAVIQYILWRVVFSSYYIGLHTGL